MAHIHPLALVDPAAEIGRDVTIGPFCIVEAGAVIGDGCSLAPRVTVKSRTTLGLNNEVGEGTVLGGKAQHVVESQPGGSLVIGDHNRIRENATIHRGHANDAATVVGNHNYLMVSAHVGHDCRIGNHTIIVNNAMIGGHVHIH
ncbi:MAG TPA: acyl-ACP--UDP-N-acetylglucosamine O-acyltransferase, partial [Pirellulaceae bacterium]|nr:acyl-ACP--UDP-N-acetylglucosamine O-acyltransferase [Pirellulaceae bacterium]